MGKWKRTIEAIEDLTSGLLIVAGLALIFVGVIMRYVFNNPLGFVEEISGYIIVWGIMVGTVVALRDNKHIRVDMLYQKFPPRLQKVTDIFSNVVGLLFALFLAYYGAKGIFFDEYSVYKMDLTSIGEGVSLWKIYLIMPIIGVLLTFRFIVRLIRLVKGLPESDADEDGGVEVL